MIARCEGRHHAHRTNTPASLKYGVVQCVTPPQYKKIIKSVAARQKKSCKNCFRGKYENIENGGYDNILQKVHAPFCAVPCCGQGRPRLRGGWGPKTNRKIVQPATARPKKLCKNCFRGKSENFSRATFRAQIPRTQSRHLQYYHELTLYHAHSRGTCTSNHEGHVASLPGVDRGVHV